MNPISLRHRDAPHRTAIAMVGICLVLVTMCAGIGTVAAASGIYRPINYQGKLTNSGGVAIANGNYDMRFKIFSAATGGSPVWSEVWNSGNQKVTATGGLFSIALGTHTSMTGSVDFNSDSLFLQVEFDPGTDGVFEEVFTPRRRFASVPYAHNADTLDGLDSTQFIRTDVSQTASGTLTISPRDASKTALDLLSTAGNVAALKISTQGANHILFGSGAANYDVNLYRSAANVLKTDDSFIAVGTISGSSLVVSGNASVSGSLVVRRSISGATLEVLGTASGLNLFATQSVSGTHLYAATTFGGAGLGDCDTAATSKLLWDSATKRFSCGTDQTGGSAGTASFSGAVLRLGDARYVRKAGDTMTGALIINIQGGSRDTLGLRILNTLSGAHIHAEQRLTSSGVLVTESGATFDGGTLFVDAVNNRVAVGTTSPSSLLEVVSGGANSVQFQVNGGPESPPAASPTDYGLYVMKTGSSLKNVTRTIEADLIMNNNAGSAGAAGTAIWANAIYSGSQDFSHIVGTQSYATASGSGVIDRLYGQVSKPDTKGLGTVNDLYGQYIYAPTTSVGTTNAYGIFIEDYGSAASVNNYAIYSGNGKVYLNGHVGIGLLNPSYGQLQVSGIPDSTYGNISAMDSTSMAQGVGGAIAFVGNYTGVTPVTFGLVKGVKENGTDGDYRGAMTFTTNPGGSPGLSERMRIDSSGNVGIGTTTPGSRLSVSGSVIVGSNGSLGSSAADAGLALEVLGTASGLNLFATRSMTGSHLHAATTFGGAGLADCDSAATSKLLWDSATKRFSCGTDQTGGSGGSAPEVGTASYSGGTLRLGDARYVKKQGDTMTGALVIDITGSNTTVGLNVLNTISGALVRATKQITSSGTLVTESGATFDGGTLFVDAVNNRVGIGTTTPQSMLSVIGRLAAGSAIELTPNQATGIHSYDYITAGGGTQTTKSYGNLYLYNSSNEQTTQFASYPGVVNFVNNGGGLGVGTNSPKSTLDVVGTISGMTLTVSNSGSFSGSLMVKKSLSGAALEVLGTASGQNLFATHSVTGTHLYAATTFNGAGLADCDTAATSKLLWDSATKRFSCGTDQDIREVGTSSFSGATLRLGDARYVKKQGDTMTGQLVISLTSGTIGLKVLAGMSGNTLTVNKGANFGGSGVLISATGAAVFNEQSRNVDFRIEGDGNANLFFLDASADSIGIGKHNPKAKLDIQGALSGAVLVLSGGASFSGSVAIGDSATDTLTVKARLSGSLLPVATNLYDLGSSSLRWRDLYLSGGTLRLGSQALEGKIGYASSGSEGLQFYGTGGARTPALVVSSGGRIGIGTTNPESLLHVTGTNTAEVRLTASGTARLVRSSALNALAWHNTVRTPSGTYHAVQFDGIDDRISFSPISLGTTYSATLLFKRGDSEDDILISTSSSNFGTLVGIYGASNQLYTSDDNEEITVAYGDWDSDWHHLAVVRDNTSVTFFIDGTVVGTGSFSTSGAISPDQIGTYWSGSSHNYTGLLDEVRLYDRALSTSEVTAQYNGGAGQYGAGDESGLAAGWHFDEGTGTSASDYSGNGSPGTLTNGPSWQNGKVPASQTLSEVIVWSSQDGEASGEQGVHTFGPSLGGTRLQGQSLKFLTGGSERFRVSSGGFLGIGTSTPGSALTVSGAVIIGHGFLGTATADAGLALEIIGSASGTYLHAGTELSSSGTLVVASTAIVQGNVGIGVAAPTARLQIAQTDAADAEAILIDTEESTAAQDVFRIVSDVAGDEDNAFRIQADGTVYSDNTYNSSGADYAEWFLAADGTLQPGEAVCLDLTRELTVKRCDRSGDPNVMGIVSTKPAFVGNRFGGADGGRPKNAALVGLIGQLPAKAVAEDGRPVAVGDPLAPAAKPGYIRKARPGESTVGVALSGLPSGEGGIEVLITRRNQSDLVEKIEAEVAQSIAAMNIEDDVRALAQAALSGTNVNGTVAAAVNAQVQSLDLAARINAVLDERLADGGLSIGSPGDAVAELVSALGTQTGSVALQQAVSARLGLTRTGTAALLAGSDLVVSGALTVHHDVLVGGTLYAAAVAGPVRFDGPILPGTDFAIGSLSFSGSAVRLGSLTDGGSLQVLGDVTVDGFATLRGRVEIAGELSLNGNHVGHASVQRGRLTARVAFSGAFATLPIVTASPDQPVPFAVRDVTATGFLIQLGSPAVIPVRFAWHALGTTDPTDRSSSVEAVPAVGFPVDELGRPYSADDAVWTACVRDPAAYDVCTGYHQGSTWFFHPDLVKAGERVLPFAYDSAAGPQSLALPPEYVPVITPVPAVLSTTSIEVPVESPDAMSPSGSGDTVQAPDPPEQSGLAPATSAIADPQGDTAPTPPAAEAELSASGTQVADDAGE